MAARRSRNSSTCTKFIRHVAIENFLAEEDGITGDYGPNNFYFYRYENKSLFKFIPWDKSNTFWESAEPELFHLPEHRGRCRRVIGTGWSSAR